MYGGSEKTRAVAFWFGVMLMTRKKISVARPMGLLLTLLQDDVDDAVVAIVEEVLVPLIATQGGSVDLKLQA